MTLQALYCFVWFLVYVDMGLISSNGVTGTRSTDPSDTESSVGGLQVRTFSSFFQELRLGALLGGPMRSPAALLAPVDATLSCNMHGLFN